MRWISFAGLMAVVPVGALLLSGCDPGVTCIDNDALPICELSVGLEHTVWEPGNYVFEATPSGETRRCAATLPDPTRESWDCSHGDWGISWGDWGKEPYPSRLAWAYPSGEVTVRILYQDQEIAKETFRPRYETTEPYGDGCGVCRNAEVTMEF